MSSSAPPPEALARRISGLVLTLYALGTILGAGIYVLIGKVAASAGMYVPLAFVVAALVAGLTGLTYAELAARYPRAAGAALYVQTGLRRRWLSVTVGFLVILTGVVSAATMANGFVGYLHVFAPIPGWAAKSLLIIALGLIAAWGIAESVGLAALITFIEIGGLLLILAVSGESLSTFPIRAQDIMPPMEGQAWLGIFAGAFLAFYAYIGFEDTVNVAEEVKDPQKNLPRAILSSLVLATLLYVLIALVAVLSLPLTELAQSTAPLALIYQRATGQTPTLISLISLFAVINGALIQIIMGSRLLYGMSREGWLPAWVATIHPKTRTPWLATAVITLVVGLLAIAFPLVTLAKATSFVILAIFALLHLALLRIKRETPTPSGVRVYPRFIPITGLFTTLVLIGLQLSAL